MTRCLAWLLHLYPRQWRERYGREFLALAEDSNLSWGDCPDVLKGAIAVRWTNMRQWPIRRTLLIFTVAGGLVAATVAVVLPRRYHSSITVGIADGIPSVLAQQVSTRFDAIASRKTLHEVIQRHRLYEPQQRREPLEQVIDGMKRAIRVSNVTPSGNNALAFEIGFGYTDPQAARLVTLDLANAFVEGQPGWRVLPSQDDAESNSPVFPNVRNLILTGVLAGLLLGSLFTAVISRIQPRQPQLHA